MSLFSKVRKLVRRDRAALHLSRKRSRAATDRVCQFLFEAIEPRLFMSASDIAHPTFVIHHPVNSAVPDAATGSPTGDSPSTIRTAYGVNLAMFGSVSGDGTGQTIAIVDAYNEPTLKADLTAFDSYYSLAAINLTQVNETGGSTLPASDTKGGCPQGQHPSRRSDDRQRFRSICRRR
jgi:hypothetical protein